jgi:hypothetical protein
VVLRVVHVNTCHALSSRASGYTFPATPSGARRTTGRTLLFPPL